MRLLSPLLAIHLGFMALLPLGAQGTKADYERWAGQQELTKDKVYRGQVVPVWNRAGTVFLYSSLLPGGRTEWICVENEKKRPAFDEGKFKPAMEKALGKPVDLSKTRIEAMDFGDGAELIFRLDEKLWKIADPNARAYSISETPARPTPAQGGGRTRGAI